MTSVSPALPTSFPPPDGDITLAARAYCGPAHGRRWIPMSDSPLPEDIELDDERGSSRYQLVRNPQSRLPAHDRHGNLVYMPQRYGAAPSASGPLPGVHQPYLPAVTARTVHPAE